MQETHREQIKLTKNTRARLDGLGCKADSHEMIMTRLIQRYESLAPKRVPDKEYVTPAPLQRPLVTVRITKTTKRKLDTIGGMNDRYEDIIIRLLDCYDSHVGLVKPT